MVMDPRGFFRRIDTAVAALQAEGQPLPAPQQHLGSPQHQPQGQPPQVGRLMTHRRSLSDGPCPPRESPASSSGGVRCGGREDSVVTSPCSVGVRKRPPAAGNSANEEDCCPSGTGKRPRHGDNPTNHTSGGFGEFGVDSGRGSTLATFSAEEAPLKTVAPAASATTTAAESAVTWVGDGSQSKDRTQATMAWPHEFLPPQQALAKYPRRIQPNSSWVCANAHTLGAKSGSPNSSLVDVLSTLVVVG